VLPNTTAVPGRTASAVPGAMTHLGWWKESPNRLARWVPPLLDPQAPAEEFEVIDGPDETDDVEAAEACGDAAELEWVVDLEAVDPSATLGQLLALYRAAGMTVEVRLRTKAVMPDKVPASK